MTCGAAIAGAIPVDRSAPDWWPRILTLLDRHAAKHRGFPSLWRSALRSDRPKQPGSNLAAPRESVCLSPSTGERLALQIASVSSDRSTQYSRPQTGARRLGPPIRADEVPDSEPLEP